MAEAQSSSKGGSKGGSQRAAGKVRTAGDYSPGAASQRGRSAERPGSAAARANTSTTGATARLLAPLALVVCLIAVFVVLSGGGEKASTSSGAKDSQTSSQGSSSGEDSADASTESGSTGPVRSTYRVKPGDSFAAIAEKTGVEVDTLAELNPDVDPRALQPGQKLKLK